MNNNLNCKWLTPIITLDQFNNDWQLYNNHLYKLFVRDFIDNTVYFNRKKIQIRINPKQDNYEHGFIHLTCISTEEHNDPNDRIPDLRRCERIEWNKEIIENYKCNNNCNGCKKIMYYEEYYKNTVRINLLFYDFNFKVILEKRNNYYLLITGYYIQYNHKLQKEKRKYDLYTQQKTPLD